MGLYEAIKDAANVARKADNIELYQKVLDLQAQALEEQEEQAKLRSRVRELEAEVARLKTELDFAGNLQYDDRIQAYTLQEPNNRIALFCSRCWDTARKAVRLHDYKNGWWGCPDCKSTIEHGHRSSW